MANKTVYRCKSGMVSSAGGRRYHFGAGDLVLEDHPVNPARNGNFEEVSAYVERTSKPIQRGPISDPVEQATADPGERRSIGSLLGLKREEPPAPQAEASEKTSERPPTSGRGSGVEAWREYAAAVTDSPVESWESLSRDEIIELLDSEGASHDGQE